MRGRATDSSNGQPGALLHVLGAPLAALLLALTIPWASSAATPRPAHAATGASTPEPVVGTVTYADGSPAAGVGADLFSTAEDGGRERYLRSTTTDDAGHYRFEIGDGCYVVVLIAPGTDAFLGTGRYRQGSICIEEGRASGRVDAELHAARAVVRGRVDDSVGGPAVAVAVDLFVAAGDASRGPYVGSTTTDVGGHYSFEVAPGCYIVVMIAPPGETFPGTGPYHELGTCMVAGRSGPELSARLAGSGEPAAPLSAVESEIVRLTNELRADPAGPLARRKPMPSCVAERFYAIAIDPASGHPEPAPPLQVSEAVSTEMARAWAVGLQRRDDFFHRPSTAQQAIYSRLGLHVSAWGENIAWSSGYSAEATAWIHFEGWRESDTGHYCSLLTRRFTNVGVGEHRVDDQSWAVQNFFTTGAPAPPGPGVTAQSPAR